MTDLDARYGRSTRPRWFWPTFAAVGIALGIAFAAWVGFQDKPISSQLWGYEVVDDNRVDVSIDLYRSGDAAATCTVYAQAEDHSIVGEKTVDVAPAPDQETRVEIVIETERRAVTGVLRTCELVS